jgi:hypothetical protein
LRHLRRGLAARAGRQAEIKRGNARSGAVQDAEPVPAILDRAEFARELGGEREDGRAVFACQRACADENERMLGRFQRLGEFALADTR